MSRLYRRALRPLLFRLEPETAHNFAAACCIPLAAFAPLRGLLRAWTRVRAAELQTEVCGIRFPNPVGMAAGFDKTGRLYPFLAAAGFGFVEQGTFTQQPQAGNPRPRLFRYAREEALVNRMGFNNPGARRVSTTLQGQATSVPRGISIGKSRLAALPDAATDQAAALRHLARFGDYIAINVSSPNTPGLRDLQSAANLRAIVSAARQAQPQSTGRPQPLFVKLAPDFDRADFEELVGTAVDLGVDGLILTNTTLAREAVPSARDVPGGLSGAPVRELSTQWIRLAYQLTDGRLPIMGVGGVFSGRHALEKIRAGASLVQLYTGYIFEGPGLPRAINRQLAAECRRRRCGVADLVGLEES